MGIESIWDTNTAIYYLQQLFPPAAEKYIDESLINSQPCISVITEIELLCWKTTSEKDIEVLNNFISDVMVIELDNPIKNKTAEIRKTYKIKLPDAIIAASALVYGYTLITRNISDFKSIKGLNLIDPHNL
ncbi:MAG: type II toxin-antitoxin system VapC family toxin [Saprospiraceae bacterium]|nr:type II toxin-antitoxin system VapC family toxin [Saprospiraceae bacterium]